jgi:uncharacterized protein YciI
VYLYFRSVDAPDYFERRDRPFPAHLSASRYGPTHRVAHITMYLAARDAGRVLGAGPSPDGVTADCIFNFESRDAFDEFLKDDPYVIGGVWTSWSVLDLNEFVAPIGAIPVCWDGTRRITVVEESVEDPDRAAAALRTLQDQGSLVLGGIGADGTVIAWMHASDPEQASSLWRGVGMNASAKATCRPLVWVL